MVLLFIWLLLCSFGCLSAGVAAYRNMKSKLPDHKQKSVGGFAASAASASAKSSKSLKKNKDGEFQCPFDSKLAIVWGQAWCGVVRSKSNWLGSSHCFMTFYFFFHEQ
eukprot:TRINITY_DN55140_c0_g1_i1.p2 TRINITY_DN55140_c0_g1~~TRINITY_DN55140_c0_g1_i1.p2  ORF type:complete len:108 (+),score=10.30 TRINITY_DN55140_c0_g1_i1:54-377(+)